MKLYEEQELTHHGILGQKWGVRRFQNKDGTLTEAGKKRVRELSDKTNKLINESREHSKAIDADTDFLVSKLAPWDEYSKQVSTGRDVFIRQSKMIKNKKTIKKNLKEIESLDKNVSKEIEKKGSDVINRLFAREMSYADMGRFGSGKFDEMTEKGKEIVEQMFQEYEMLKKKYPDNMKVDVSYAELMAAKPYFRGEKSK